MRPQGLLFSSKILSQIDVSVDKEAILVVIELPNGIDVGAGKFAFQSTLGVAEVTLDYLMERLHHVTEPLLKDQPALTTISWKKGYTHPSAQAIGAVTVAVLDTGIEPDHPEFAGRLLTGKNFTGGDATDTRDRHGHGTHCAGIIGALDANVGIAGVAAGVRLLPVKVLGDNGSGFSSALIAGIKFAADQGAKILSVSLGFGSPTIVKPIAEAIAYGRSKGVLVVASAGNEATEVSYPATDINAIAVSSTIKASGAEALSSFSNRGEKIEISAPDSSILSTVNGTTAKPVQSAFAYKSGTSMAAPFVAGAAALVVTAFPDLTAEQVTNRLRQGVDDLGAPGRDKEFGFGRLNLAKVLAAGVSDGPTPAATPLPSRITTVTLQPTTLTLNALPATGEPDPRFFTSRQLVAGVDLDRTGLSLNALPEQGDPERDFPTSTTLVANVRTTLPFNGGVTWTSSDVSRLTVDAAGTASTVRGALKGSAIVTATAVDDPSQSATASVVITANGRVRLEVR